MSSELITLLEKEAATERERILSEARAEAEAIRAAAREEAQRVVQTQREQQEARLRAAGVRAESTASLRGSVTIKGKGEMETWFLIGPRSSTSPGARETVSLRPA